MRKLNPSPQKAYEIRMTLANAPGAFGAIDGFAQFDVQNPGECGDIDPFIGAIPRISSIENFTLTEISDREYVGIVHADQIVDEDYFGNGVCRWALAAASVALRANEDVGNTRFVNGLSAELVRAQRTKTRYFWSGFYPRGSMDTFRDLGVANLDQVSVGERNEFFSITLSAKEWP